MTQTVKSIWGNRPEEAWFRKKFRMDSPAKTAILRIYVDTGYELFLNGRFVAVVDEWNNTRDYEVGAYLVSGENLVAVHGMNHAGHRGFSFELALDGKTEVVSDVSWKVCDFEKWECTLPSYDDSAWTQAVELPMCFAGSPQWKTRPGQGPYPIIKPLKCSQFFQGDLPKCIESPIYRKKNETQKPSPKVLALLGDEYAESQKKYPEPYCEPVKFIRGNATFHADKTERYTGPDVTMDFGKEVVGFLRFRLESDASVSFRIHYGETIGEVYSEPNRDQLQYRMLTEEIRIFKGVQEWESRVRVGFRFVRIEFFDCEKPVTADCFGLRTECYPVEYKGYFHCTDERLNRIWEASRKTLHLCMQEYYIDAVKRDRMLWIGDTRAEALYNYYLFGDAELFRFCWDEVAECQYADGSIPSAMCEGSSLIWDYVNWWVIAFHDYYMHTGDAEFLKKHAKHICTATDWLLSKCNADGLFVIPENPYKRWMVVLDSETGISSFHNEITLRSAETALETCRLSADTDGIAKYEAVVNKMRPAVEKLRKESPVRENRHLLGHSTGCYEIAEDFFAAGKKREALDFIRKIWGTMLEKTEADTLFEGTSPKGVYPSEEDPDSRTYISFCHGWTSGPAALFAREIAGIKPLEPGFAKFSVEPNLCGLNSLECIVPTPHGEIALKIADGKASLLVPAGTEATVKTGNEMKPFPSGLHEFSL